MDNIVYGNAPLVELIVQLQWQVETIGVAGAPQIVVSQSADFDIWFSSLTSRLGEKGYNQIERLVPTDMPPMAHQAIYRYRKPDSLFPVIQFGHGVFTINSGPPSYQSWKDFRPTVQSAIDALIASTSSGESFNTFTNASMRYVDIFDNALRAGMPNYQFIKDELGISLNFPFELGEYASNEKDINPTFSFVMPIKDNPNSKLAFQIASGVHHIGNKPSTEVSTIMDINYIVDSDIERNTNEILSLLDNSRSFLHEWFTKITKKIDHRMSPNTEQEQ